MGQVNARHRRRYPDRVDATRLRAIYLASGVAADREAFLAALPAEWDAARRAVSLAKVEFEAERYPQARAALGEDPRDAAGCYLAARCAVVAKAFRDAVRLFERAWELLESDPAQRLLEGVEPQPLVHDHLVREKEVAYYLGRIYEQAGRKADAIRCYRRIVAT